RAEAMAEKWRPERTTTTRVTLALKSSQTSQLTAFRLPVFRCICTANPQAPALARFRNKKADLFKGGYQTLGRRLG
ncbi:MAG: hypothetical protein PHV68_07600, partial [Candidatus Gastranaerophilales bacterium]|nr:hypothetical protein [Candidatus Gastranaerophilales bacterium]